MHIRCRRALPPGSVAAACFMRTHRTVARSRLNAAAALICRDMSFLPSPQFFGVSTMSCLRMLACTYVLITTVGSTQAPIPGCTLRKGTALVRFTGVGPGPSMLHCLSPCSLFVLCVYHHPADHLALLHPLTILQGSSVKVVHNLTSAEQCLAACCSAVGSAIGCLGWTFSNADHSCTLRGGSGVKPTRDDVAVSGWSVNTSHRVILRTLMVKDLSGKKERGEG